MVRFQSAGGRNLTPAERHYSVAKSGLIFVIVIALAIGAYFGINHLVQTNKESETVATPAACSAVIENSVFSTGDPLLDQRILYAILSDKSEGKETSGSLVQHIWEKKNFAFTDQPVADLWNQAVKNVVAVESAITAPALSITADGIITPFKENSDTRDINWVEVQVSDRPSQVSTFLAISVLSEQTQSTPVPTVLLSINNANVVPAPYLGQGSQTQIVEAKKVCNE